MWLVIWLTNMEAAGHRLRPDGWQSRLPAQLLRGRLTHPSARNGTFVKMIAAAVSAISMDQMKWERDR